MVAMDHDGTVADSGDQWLSNPPSRLPRRSGCPLGKRELVFMLLMYLLFHYVCVTLSFRPLPAWCQMCWLRLVIVALPELSI